jgi:hypothetical protein
MNAIFLARQQKPPPHIDLSTANRALREEIARKRLQIACMTFVFC